MYNAFSKCLNIFLKHFKGTCELSIDYNICNYIVKTSTCIWKDILFTCDAKRLKKYESESLKSLGTENRNKICITKQKEQYLNKIQSFKLNQTTRNNKQRRVMK
jgi:hypothetical protein